MDAAIHHIDSHITFYGTLLTATLSVFANIDFKQIDEQYLVPHLHVAQTIAAYGAIATAFLVFYKFFTKSDKK